MLKAREQARHFLALHVEDLFKAVHEEGVE
jgi:hypothetical protein